MLPQQPPFRYVDVVQYLDRSAQQGVLRLSLQRGQNRWGCAEVLPGYLLIEAMAQAAGVLLRDLTVGEPGGFLVGIEKAQLPPDVSFPSDLEMLAELRSATPPFFTLDVQVRRMGEPSVLACAELQVMTHRNIP